MYAIGLLEGKRVLICGAGNSEHEVIQKVLQDLNMKKEDIVFVSQEEIEILTFETSKEIENITKILPPPKLKVIPIPHIETKKPHQDRFIRRFNMKSRW